MYDGIISLDNIKKISVSYFIINAIVWYHGPLCHEQTRQAS